MEVIKGHVADAQFVVPHSLTAATYKVFKEDETQIGSTKNAVIVSGSGVATCALPYSALSETGWIEVVLTFTFNDGFVSQTYDKSQWVEVVEPILNEIEIKEIHPNATETEITRIEKAVRHIINAHTGQKFSLYHGIHTVEGNNTSTLQLPERLIQLEQVNGEDAGAFYAIGADGWVLHHYPWGVPPLKADYYGLHYTTNGVIRNPDNVSMSVWKDTSRYEVYGSWGWVEVPPQVKEAAKLLVNDYACADQTYRDRYLTSMTAADWRIQYHSGAFRETGNVRADQLLNDYVLKKGWAVI